MSEPWRWIAPEWMWHATIVMGNVAAWMGCALATLLAIRRSDDAAAFSLSLFLSLAALAWGSYGVQHSVEGIGIVALSRTRYALQFGSILFSTVACLRFASLFPRPVQPSLIKEVFEAGFAGKPVEMRDSFGELERKLDKMFQPISKRYRRAVNERFQKLNDRATPDVQARIINFHRALLQLGTAWRWAGYTFILVALFCALGWTSAAGVLVGFPLLFCFIVSVLYMRVGFAVNDEADRQRSLWVVEGFVATMIPGMVVELVLFPFLLFNAPVEGLFLGGYVLALATGSIVLVVCLAIATFFSGAFDAALVIRRTTIYSAMVVVLTGTFAVIENLVTTLITTHTSLPSSIGGLIAAAVVAIGFAPLRHKLKKFVETRMPSLAQSPKNPIIPA